MYVSSYAFHHSEIILICSVWESFPNSNTKKRNLTRKIGTEWHQTIGIIQNHRPTGVKHLGPRTLKNKTRTTQQLITECDGLICINVFRIKCNLDHLKCPIIPQMPYLHGHITIHKMKSYYRGTLWFLEFTNYWNHFSIYRPLLATNKHW